MESLTGRTSPTEFKDIPQLFDDARNILFPDFPIYDEAHRKPLQNLIMSHFLTREICLTPYARWQLMFQQKLLIGMEYFNGLYTSFAGVNIFDDVNYSREINTQGNVIMSKGTIDTTEQTGTTTSDGSFKPGATQIVTNTTTPQTDLQNFLDNSYVSSASKSTTEGEDNSLNTTDMQSTGSIKRGGQDEDTEVRDVTEKVKGKRGSKSYFELMQEAQAAIFSVDQMVLDYLEELFFCIY